MFVYCNATSLKRSLHVFSAWISCLIKDLSAFYKARLVLILGWEKYIENLFSNASSKTFRHHKLVTLPSKIMRLAGRKKNPKLEEKTQIEKNIIIFWNHFFKLFHATVRFWCLLSFKMGRDSSHSILQHNTRKLSPKPLHVRLGYLI